MKTSLGVVFGLLAGLFLTYSLGLAQDTPLFVNCVTTTPQATITHPIFGTATALSTPKTPTATTVQLTKIATPTLTPKFTGTAPSPTIEVWAVTPARAVYRVLAPSGLNIRVGTSLDKTILGSYPYGATFFVSEQVTANGYIWGHTDRGWVALRSLSGTTFAQQQ